MCSGEVNSLRGEVVPDDEEEVGLAVYLLSSGSMSSNATDSGRKPRLLLFILILRRKVKTMII